MRKANHTNSGWGDPVQIEGLPVFRQIKWPSKWVKGDPIFEERTCDKNGTPAQLELLDGLRTKGGILDFLKQ